jgi:hypothetical protein
MSENIFLSIIEKFLDSFSFSMFTNHWDALKFSLQALAQPAMFQHRLLSVWLEDVSELPEQFVQAERHLVRGQGVDFTPEQQAALDALHARFESFCGPANAEHWADHAVESSPQWADIRRLAVRCLVTFGWPVAEPPLDVSSYGDDYH